MLAKGKEPQRHGWTKASGKPGADWGRQTPNSSPLREQLWCVHSVTTSATWEMVTEQERGGGRYRRRENYIER